MKVVDIYLILLQKLSNLPRNEEVLIDLKSNSVTGNRIIWNGYDWSRGGEEWTEDAATYKSVDAIKWKTSIINGMILKYFTEDSVIIEIGPGAGRWTAVLLRLANRLILVDISKKALDICRERFKGHNIEYVLLEDPNLDFISDESVDYVWSYDVFVHINPTDVENYIFHIQRILRPGGYAIVHHADQVSVGTRVFGIRSYMNKKSFENVIGRYGMKMIEQNTNLVHFPGDVISVFRK